MISNKRNSEAQVAMLNEAAIAALQGKAEVVSTIRALLVDILEYMTTEQFTATLLYLQAEIITKTEEELV